MDFTTAALLFAGGVVAGLINVMAGGAGFMTFPLLMAAGMTELEANASNFVAVLPANVVGSWVYRHEIKDVRQHLWFRMLLAAAGGVTGSLLVVYAGQEGFTKTVPWLLVIATLSFGFGPMIKAKLERDFAFDGRRWMWLSFVLEFIVYVYGGYFGLGMGIMLFTIYAMFSRANIHEANALRNTTITLMTVISIVIFAKAGVIRLAPALVMMAGSVVGSYFMARIARRLPAQRVRVGILAWAVVLTAVAFWRYL